MTNKKRVLFLEYLALLSCGERIPWGTRRSKTGQENNPRKKVREVHLVEKTHNALGKTQCRVGVQKVKRESWQPTGRQ